MHRPEPPRRRRARRALAALLAIALAAVASPALAATIGLEVDPARSQLLFEGEAAQPLSGQLAVTLPGAGPPVSARTALGVTALAIGGAGLDIALDPSQANPGLGVLDPDGSFSIPLLFLSVDDGSGPVGLTLLDVTGTFGPDASCGGALCLQTSLVVDTGAIAGLATVDLVAIPEPGTALLVLLAPVALGAAVFRSDRQREELRR